MQKEWRHFIQRVDYTSSPARCAFKKASAPWQNERALILRFAYSFRNGGVYWTGVMTRNVFNLFSIRYTSGPTWG